MVKIDYSEISKFAGNVHSISQTASIHLSKEKTHELVASIQKLVKTLDTFQEMNKQSTMIAAEIVKNQDFSKLINSITKVQFSSSLSSFKTLSSIVQEIDVASISNIRSSLKVINQLTPTLLDSVSRKDFRVSVASQELEQAFNEDLEEATENLLFKDTSEPSNALESQFFDILTQQRKILNDSEKILKEIDSTKSKNITEKPSDKKHDSPAFYEDKMWYLEQIASNIIGLVVVAIFDATIGADPSNTLGFALLLGCLHRFIKPKP